MKINVVRNFVNNFIFGFLYKILSILFPFFIRTIMIKKLGTEYSGINSLFTAVLQALNLAELGFGSAMVFNMYAAVAANDTDKLCAYMNFYRKVYRIIGATVLFMGLLLAPFIKYIIKGSYPTDINIYYVYFIFLIDTVFSYWMYAYKNSIALAYQRTDIESKAMAVTQMLLSVMQLLVLSVFVSFYAYVIAIPIATIVKNLLISHEIDKNFPDIKAEGELDESEKKAVFNSIKGLFGHQIAFTVVNSVDNIVLTALLGLHEQTIYNNYYIIFSSVMAVLTILFKSIQAGIGNDIIVNSKYSFPNFRKFRLFVFIIVELSCACLFTMTQPFMKLWMGNKLMLSKLSVCVFCLGFYIVQIRKVITTYKNAAGIWNKDLIKPYIVIIVDLLIDIILVKRIGSIGAMISTIVSMGIVALPWETVVLYNSLFSKKSREHFIFIVYEATLFVISLVVLDKLLSYFNFAGVMAIGFNCIFTLVYESIFLLIINIKQPEMKWLFDRTVKLIRDHE